VSSTEAEHEAAIARAREVFGQLHIEGWPEPLIADSGNGAHLLYRIALPNDAKSTELLKRCLQALALRFSDDLVNVDEKVFNAARIWKVYGTIACKGDNTAERPHRQAKLLQIPDELEVVSLDKLTALADTAPKPSQRDARDSGGERFDLDRWISDHGLDVGGPVEWSGGRKWIFRVCPWNEEHRNRSAYIVQFLSGAIAAGCHHNGCNGKDWAALRAMYEPEYRAAGHRGPARDEHRPGNGAASEGFHGPDEVQIEAPRSWPILPKAAMFGIFKEIVEVSTKSSEADPAAVLLTTLTFASAFVGTAPFTWVGDTRHYARLYAVLVGASSRARKGTSRDPVERIFREAQRMIHGMNKKPFPLGLNLAITPGPLSSGEGLVNAVRDPSDALDKEGEPIDQGVEDKRLLVVDGEFGAALRAAQRDGNTLSAILRSGWDHGCIAPLTKNNRIKASGAHINFVAHITLEELSKLLESVDLWNGFANRILWAVVRRSAPVPRPRPIPKEDLARVAQMLSEALMDAVACGEMQFDSEASDLWDRRYPKLTEDHSGALGAVTARAEAQVLRMALLYAVMDKDAKDIGLPHLRAAIAMWEYCFASARYIFGDAEAHPEVNKLLAALSKRDLSLTDINGLFSGHKSKSAIKALLDRLQATGRVTLREERGGPFARAKTTVSLRK